MKRKTSDAIEILEDLDKNPEKYASDAIWPKYHGITYPKGHSLAKWKKTKCPKNMHLFDEVTNSDREHYLVCDACGLYVYISKIETEKEACAHIMRGK